MHRTWPFAGGKNPSMRGFFLRHWNSTGNFGHWNVVSGDLFCFSHFPRQNNILRHVILTNTSAFNKSGTRCMVPMPTHSWRHLTLIKASAFNRSDTRCWQWQNTTLSYFKQYIGIQQKWYKMLPMATHYAILF